MKDRYEKVFPAVCCCHPWKIKNTGNPEYCYNMIYNSVPFGLPGEKTRVLALGMQSLRLMFTIEDAKETKEVLEEFATDLNIAVLGDFRITHNKKKITVPYGASSEIKDGKFIIYNK